MSSSGLREADSDDDARSERSLILIIQQTYSRVFFYIYNIIIYVIGFKSIGELQKTRE